jgi:hypothetical protein
MIQRNDQRNDAPNGNESISRLEADGSAEGCWCANRSAGIGTQSSLTEFSGNRRSGATGRPARVPLKGPRIPHRAKVTGSRGTSERKLMQIRFADEHCASGLQFANHFSIFGWDSLIVNGAGGGCARLGQRAGGGEVEGASGQGVHIAIG